MTVMAEPPIDDVPADGSTAPLPVIQQIGGPARIGTVRDLAARARQGDVLVIDVLDLREAEADALVRTGASGVINAKRTASGRQPAAGARRLLDAGLAVIDGAGPAVLAVREGTSLTLVGDSVLRGDEPIASGTALTLERIEAADTAALDHLKVQVAVFGSHAIERLEREGALFFEGVGLPDLGVKLAGRVVLVVAHSPATAEHLRSLKLFIKDRRPIVIAEGGAVEACLAARLRPSVIVGGVADAPDAALRAARVLTIASDEGATARLEAIGAHYDTSDIALAGADIATLAAHHAGAEVIVVAGSKASAVDVLSADPEVGIGAFLTSLVARGSAADAEVVAATYRHRHSVAFIVTMLALAGATLVVALLSVGEVRDLAQQVWDTVVGWFGGSS